MPMVTKTYVFNQTVADWRVAPVLRPCINSLETHIDDLSENIIQLPRVYCISRQDEPVAVASGGYAVMRSKAGSGAPAERSGGMRHKDMTAAMVQGLLLKVQLEAGG